MSGGRPSDYTVDIAEEICEAIARGGALYLMCETHENWPDEATVYRWLGIHDEFREKYAYARERQADKRNDEIIVIADNCDDVNKAKLQVDARKWQASKLAPKKYGDRMEHVGSGGGPLQVQVVKFAEEE